MDEGKGERVEGAIFKDIRRYFCQYCGICRSKKSLITSHILTHHPEEIENGGKEEEEILSSNTCDECGATFKKPAHLKQHLQSHSFEESFLFIKKKKYINGCYSVKHWIPQKELQNARGCIVMT